MTDNIGFALPELAPAVAENICTRVGQVTTLPDSLLEHHTIIERHDHGPFHCSPPYNTNLVMTCHVTLFTLSDDRQVIVMSEVADNPGSSVTNSVDFLVPAVYEALGTRSVEDTVFVEHHHSQLSYHGEATVWERFDRIITEADGNGHPAPQGWAPLYRSEDEGTDV